MSRDLGKFLLKRNVRSAVRHRQASQCPRPLMAVASGHYPSSSEDFQGGGEPHEDGWSLLSSCLATSFLLGLWEFKLETYRVCICVSGVCVSSPQSAAQYLLGLTPTPRLPSVTFQRGIRKSEKRMLGTPG